MRVLMQNQRAYGNYRMIDSIDSIDSIHSIYSFSIERISKSKLNIVWWIDSIHSSFFIRIISFVRAACCCVEVMTSKCYLEEAEDDGDADVT